MGSTSNLSLAWEILDLGRFFGSVESSSAGMDFALGRMCGLIFFFLVSCVSLAKMSPVRPFPRH